jgi:N-acetylglutamate synthase-like GNAT family acetyltransferase
MEIMLPSLIALPLAVWERDGLKAAVIKAGLPADDILAPGPQFWRFTTDDDVPAGFGGIEVHGADALMRSVVTLPPLRGRGVGRAIVKALEAEAVVMKCSAVWLLTTTARDLFEPLGYAVIDRGQVPAAIRATAQYSSLCPDSATVMVKRLG